MKKTITKRDFCHNVTRYMKEGKDLDIKGRHFGASLTFDKMIMGVDPGSEDGDDTAIAQGRKKPDGSIVIDKVTIKKSPAMGITQKSKGSGHAINCPCFACKPPKKKSA